MAGTYSVTVTLNGCVSSPATLNIVINATPSSPTVSSPVSYCQNETATPLTATAPSGNTLNWYTVATGGTASSTVPTPNTTTTGSTTYYVSQINTTTPACESGRASIVVNIKAIPVIAGTSTDPTSCTSSDGTIKLSGLTPATSSSVQYTKNSGAPVSVTLSSNTTGVIAITNLSAGSYTNITATLNGCASNAIGPFTLVNPSAPATPTASSNSPICSGSTLSLTASTTSTGNITYAWSGPNGFTSTQQNPIISNVTIAANGTYRVIATSNGCSSSAASVDVIINSAGIVSAGSNAPICSGNTLNLTSSTTSNFAVTYSWTGPNNFTSLSQNPTISNASPALSGVYTVTASSVQGSCTSLATTNVVVSAIPTIASASYIDPINCTISTGTITLNGLMPNTSYIVQYSKNGAAPTTVTLSSNSSGTIAVSNLSGGTYTNIIVTLNGCNSNSVGPFTLINTNPSPATPIASSNSPLCVGSTLNLSASSSTSNVTYSWSGPNGFTSTSQNPIINNVTVAQAGKYYVNANVNNCSSARDSVNVLIGDYPTVNLGPDLTLSPGTQHQMQSVIQNGPISQYIWTPATNLSCSNCPLPTANIQSNISYTLTVKNIYGCSASDTINIKVSCDKSQIFIPNAFTPDGDGINDLLIIRGTGTIKYFRIFNRWGEMVFERMNFRPDNVNYAWDGKIKGVAGPPDVYVYTAEAMCDNGTVLTYKGNISILK
jgi:gliding motility-associated-like protein